MKNEVKVNPLSIVSGYIGKITYFDDSWHEVYFTGNKEVVDKHITGWYDYKHDLEFIEIALKTPEGVYVGKAIKLDSSYADTTEIFLSRDEFPIKAYCATKHAFVPHRKLQDSFFVF